MKLFKKWLIFPLIILLMFGTLEIFTSCSHSYSNYKKLSYKRRASGSTGYSGQYQKKLRRSSISIHQNYVIKNKRRTSYHY
ncbi:MAG: hypothetical protein WCH34_06460 [Bacteroidota bacterium]